MVRAIEFPSRTGVWWSTDSRPISEVQEAAAELEELGYGSLWFGEAYGKEALTQAGALLAATRRMVVGTGIANIHARDALAAESGGRTLSALHPGRFILGLGVSHAPVVALRAGHYTKPLATMRDYLRRMDEVPEHGHRACRRQPARDGNSQPMRWGMDTDPPRGMGGSGGPPGASEGGAGPEAS